MTSTKKIGMVAMLESQSFYNETIKTNNYCPIFVL